MVAKYFNRSRVSPVDLGLKWFKSYRIDAFEPPGPIPVRSLNMDSEQVAATEVMQYPGGFCMTAWRQDAGEHSPLRHWNTPLPEHLRALIAGAEERDDRPVDIYAAANLYIDVSRRFVARPEGTFSGGTVAHFVGYLNNETGKSVEAALRVNADDEIGVTINDQTIIESWGWKDAVEYEERVLLPPGLNRINILYHRFWHPGRLSVSTADEHGDALAWRCNGDFR
jgi:hypothetical protein